MAKPIRAAGGLLWRDTPEGRLLALVHRPRHNDWSLPKGKALPGESDEQTALREVEEETGCRVSLSDFAGEVRYDVKGVPKIVRFWHMSLAGEPAFRASEEVDQLVWLPVAEALGKLSYGIERELVERARGD